jgi:hypothetical protein
MLNRPTQAAIEAQSPGSWQTEKLRTLRRLTLGLLLLGLVWRSMRYLLQLPIWGDEVLVALNFLRLDYQDLTQRLENGQIAPILFLWGELTACRWLGPTELSLRLLPFLAGLGSLLLFYRLTRQMLGPLASGLALGFLAVAIWPVSMCTCVKPYSFDLFWSLALLLPAVQWLKHPDQTWRLTLLTLLGPAALLGSYPSAFVAGAISLALSWPVYRRGSWLARVLFVAYNLAILAAFVAACRIGAQQLNTPNGASTTAAGMEQYWADGFPPMSPGPFLAWFAHVHTGQMAAYPIGAKDGGSTLTVLLCLIGAWQWVRERRWSWLVLCIVPFFLGLVAAALHRYPYGTACRLCQHVAPIMCLLAGLGTASLIDRMGWSGQRRFRWACAAFLALALVGVGGLVRDVVWPYHDRSALWTRRVMHEIHARVPADSRVVVCGSKDCVRCLYEWYWSLEGDRVSWSFQLDDGQLPGSPDRLWGFYYGEDGSQACEALRARLLERDSSWKLVERIPFALQPIYRRERREQCELFRFVRDRANRAEK